MTSLSVTPRRFNCATCLRAGCDCICHLVAPLASAVEVLVLQHPLEVRNAKNSARLLHLCLTGSRLAVGERFDPSELASLLTAGGRTPVLLYPATPGEASVAADLARPESLRLVVLDGTWRKSRKMLYLNPLLQSLPRLALEDLPASNYRIRKAHAPHQLSTLEATAHALAQVEKNSLHYQPLMAVFDGFVQQQSAKTAHLNPS
jgi:DTW domain-containing protein YfiP